MTKRELLISLADFGDDAEIYVIWNCEDHDGGLPIFEEIVSVKRNGNDIQLESYSFIKDINNEKAKLRYN